MEDPVKEEDKYHDCWKQTGIAGDRTCPELARLGHCHNCPRYSETGGRMLDREPPEGYLDMWTAMLAREKEIKTPGTVSVVVFRIGEEWLALSTGVFVEATEVRRVHSIPHRPNNIVLGLVNVRGDIQLCVSMADLLGLEEAEKTEQDERRRIYQRMVVVERGGDRWVFAVDELHGIRRFHPSDLQNVPVTVANVKDSYTRGIFTWKEKSVGYLDAELLFSSLRRSVP